MKWCHPHPVRESSIGEILREVLRLHLDNKPGSFAFVASRLGAAGINIDYCYGTVGKGQKDAAVILDVEDLDHAISVIEGAGK